MVCCSNLAGVNVLDGVDVVTYEEFFDKIYPLGWGGNANKYPHNRTINWEKLLTSLGEKYPPDCLFCAVNRHIDVYTPKNHEEHRGAAAVNLDNLLAYIERKK